MVNYNLSFALNNFGVRELLDCFVQIAPSDQRSETRLVDLKKKNVGICLKSTPIWIQKHRDRLAFIKIVSEL
jgi:peptide chain release factor 3